MQLEDIRNAVERFHESVQREQYLHYSGRKARLELDLIFSEHSDLFRRETLDALDREEAAVPPHLESRRKAFRKLRAFVVEHALGRAGAALSDDIAAYEAGRKLSWGGRSVGLPEAARELARESDPSARRRLREQMGTALEPSYDLRRAERRALDGAARQFGFASLLAASEAAAGIDLRALAPTVERLLEATRSDYFARLAESLELRVGLSLGQAARSDLAFWARSHTIDPLFPAAALVPTIADTLRGLGIEPEKQPGLELDAEMRSGKSARAFCAPIRVPGEIKVVVDGRGGQDGYAALLHETGHAQHFLWTSASSPPEHRLIGDRGLCEAFAFLFERLTTTSAWVAPLVGDREADYLRFQALVRAHAVRRQAGRFLFELRMRSSAAPVDPDRDYAELLGEATGVRYDAESYLEDGDLELSAPGYLRGWMLEAALSEHLRERFGSHWFQSPRASALLKEIWETGQLYTADELARELDLGPLDSDRLVDELRAGLWR